ncbi:CAP domain-containing protein [Anoxybacteroides tepidamans]|uniref:CAP domain-containing protein n=1 Tax=Anoxybacteroides tepidamans TaxID=265948 RepID=UPI000B11D62E|nr:CAP-associated domain-containing protein [Anoxybacillus tepidamans]
MVQVMKVWLAAIILLVGSLFGSTTPKAAGTESCASYTGNEKVWWNGSELKPGQIGRLTVLKKTSLVKFNGNTPVAVRTLAPGSSYRIYAFKSDYLGVGGGYYVKRDANVKYETPSKAKLAEVACIEQAKSMSAVVSMNRLAVGDSRAKVEAIYGKAKRKTVNDYGLYWETYDRGSYKDFLMVSYKNDRIAAMYTNQPIVSTKTGIALGASKQEVEKKYGTPLSYIQKGNARYMIADDEYDMYLINGNYVTFFYDKYNNNRVTAVQIVKRELEEGKKGFYGTASTSLRTAYEYQIFDLVNAVRLKNKLPLLTWDGKVAVTARKHSEDMAEHGYFDHKNLQGLSPFDRMERDGISYHVAGENIAYGQFNAIFVHEAWMNSYDHRRNVLYQDFQRLGVGVAFNTAGQPYYTQDFYTP